MATGPKAGWGGKREGAGRPKETLSMRAIQEMYRHAEKRAKETGKEVDEVLLDHIYGDDKKLSLQAIKIWKDKTMASITEGGEADQQLGPGIYLPEQRPDPAKVVPIK